jgi:hypothetical protein
VPLLHKYTTFVLSTSSAVGVVRIGDPLSVYLLDLFIKFPVHKLYFNSQNNDRWTIHYRPFGFFPSPYN